MRPWRNWYTRSTKDAVEQSLGVRFPLVAPENYTEIPIFCSCPTFQNFASIEIQRMKKFVLILAGCLAFTGVTGAWADDIGDAARVATRRGTNTNVVTSRQKSDQSGNTASTSRNATNVVSRGTNNTHTTNTVNRQSRQNNTPTIGVVTRTAITQRNNNTRTTKARATRTPTTRTATQGALTRTLTRAATTTATREDILNRNYSKCRDLFNECMDEFCANKDSQLKRCACSSRSNDFTRIKKQLENVDEKMLDFNQRLLTVSMDEKDVAVINTATEGEKAFYNTKDTSESKKTLDEIAKKLNTSFDTSKFSSGIGNVLSWSLDIDSAFDNINPLQGASTSAKSGTSLYAAALPICREMAAEVCSESDLELAENGYNVLIEQDCNTVEKTYKTAVQSARDKVLESSALLDISRLNVYQKNNADDILTCKRKMLDMLTNSTVCGENMGKCLDITGQYIDPTTGEAFLSSELANLGDLITRPMGNETWVGIPSNKPFVSFLYSKKKFLEPAMEGCQDIADNVWDAFVEDALSQIKIAQIRKLEDVRESCTTLTSQCLTNASDSIESFDARALSIFGVAADVTVNAMCNDILSSCTTILNTNDTDFEWYTGMTGIQTDITYDTIRHTCAQVGRACIIQVCTSTSGNFGLCEDIDTSINRKSIINHDACWDEVKECVASAGQSPIAEIFTRHNLTGDYPLYEYVYDISNPTVIHDVISSTQCTVEGAGEDCIYNLCYAECGDSDEYVNTHACRVCRLAESIWGNCEADPTSPLTQSGMHNRIKKPYDSTNANTLLYWFAQNTNTESLLDNCRDTTCGVGFRAARDANTGAVMCVDTASWTSDDMYCPLSQYKQISIGNGITNCCISNVLDSSNNCCSSGLTNSTSGACIPSSNAAVAGTFTITESDESNEPYYPAGEYILMCSSGPVTAGDSGVTCGGDNGKFFIIRKTNSTITQYMNPRYDGDVTQQFVTESFATSGTTTYTRTYNGSVWTWGSSITPQHWMVKFAN